jgi:hypothetical protein
MAGRNFEAEQDLDFVVRCFPEADAKSYASLAPLHRAKGKVGKANQVLAKCRSIFPEDSPLRSLELKK